jgi:hypothetical protein
MQQFDSEEKTKPGIPSVLPPPSFERVPEPEALDIETFRLAASMLLTYAVDGNVAGVRATHDPVYRTIVEGRVAPKYSSCGDLAHWLLYRLGVRAPFVNRDEGKASIGHGWRVGLNLNLLVPPPVGQCPVAVKPTKLAALPDVLPGDLLQINNQYGGHQMCVSGVDADGVVTTAEYGQPGGAQKKHTLQLISGTLFVTGAHGAYQVVSWISLADALAIPGNVGPDIQALRIAEAATLGKGLPGFKPHEL